MWLVFIMWRYGGPCVLQPGGGWVSPETEKQSSLFISHPVRDTLLQQPELRPGYLFSWFFRNLPSPWLLVLGADEEYKVSGCVGQLYSFTFLPVGVPSSSSSSGFFLVTCPSADMKFLCWQYELPSQRLHSCLKILLKICLFSFM